MVKKEHIHVIGASVIALIAIIAIVVVLVLWYLFGYNYAVLPISTHSVEALSSIVETTLS